MAPRKQSSKTVELQQADPLDEIEKQVSELEALRKTAPSTFYHAAARGNAGANAGPNYSKTVELQGRLKGFVSRLERLK